MKIHGLCIIKNEADIVELTMRHAAKWCDSIYVLDNGSTDETWQLIQRMAREMPQIVPFRSDNEPFTDDVRSGIFQEFRGRAQEGDWWCRLDGDEVYVDDPKRFLAEVPKRHHVVWSAHLQYYLTKEDWADQNPDLTVVPKCEEKDLPHYYLANAAETRFFRHRDRLTWDFGSWPRHLGLVHPKRIRVKHYQFRSPAQITVRLKTRLELRKEPTVLFDHVTSDDWRSVLKPKAELNFDGGDSHFQIEEALLPRHLETPSKRILKHLFHGTGLWP